MKKLHRALLLALALLIALAPCAGALRKEGTLPAYLRISRKSLTLPLNEREPATHQLTVTILPDEAARSAQVTWRSENPSVVTVSANGLVTARAEGTAKVYASVQGEKKLLEASCRVKVKAEHVASLKLDTDSILLDIASSARSRRLTPTITPERAAGRLITWTSSDPSVATVRDGLVTAVGKGRCTVTASCEGGKKTASCAVTCLNKSEMRSFLYTAGGDIVLGGDPKKDSEIRFDRLVSRDGVIDYTYVLKNLKPVFEKDDFSYLNIEGPLIGHGGPTRPGRQFNFIGKPEYVKFLTEGDIEVANVVNNHLNDYGTKAATIAILKNAGLMISDNVLHAYDINGVKVGFLAFITPVSVKAVAAKVADADPQCDVLIVSFHFVNFPQHEHTLWPMQVVQARNAVDNGADLVLGHHTHVSSGMQLYKGVYIYYGLGNVESSGWRFARRDVYTTFLTQQRIYFDPDTRFVYSDVPTIYPLMPNGVHPAANNCQPVLLKPGERLYEYLFNVLKNNSSTLGGTPAPYVRGVP